MAFPPRFLDDIRDRVGLAEIVGRRVRLTRKGREHSGLCPFHNEKTPSFTVSDDKGFYHCFGCGAHGDAIDFVMNTEGLSFPEAVEQLAGLAGLQMPQETPEDRAREERRAGLAEAVEAAAVWFADRLRVPEGKAALDYLKGRGLEDEIIARFRLGFAPDSRDGIKAALLKQGFTEAVLVEAGLLIRPEDGRPTYDRFRGRVIFPIADRKGRVVAFGGRVMAGDGPKYLNSPETPLFHKGHMLYNLDRAGKATREGAELIVAEGYMDVIALDRAGFHGAVAPLGTALTEDQIAVLWKHAAEPVLCFDGDTAGGRAAARAADRALPLLQPGKSLRFAVLPAGQDPDDLIAGGGPAAMRRLIDGAKHLSDVLWEVEFGAGSVNTPEHRAHLRSRLGRKVELITDPALRGDYKDEFKDRLWKAFRNFHKSTGRAAKNPESSIPSALVDIAALRRQQVILAIVLFHPDFADEFSETLAKVQFKPDLENLLRSIQTYLASNIRLDSVAMMQYLADSDDARLVKTLTSREVLNHIKFTHSEAQMRETLHDEERMREVLLHQLGIYNKGRLIEEVTQKSLEASAKQDGQSADRFSETRKDAELIQANTEANTNRLLDAQDDQD